MLTRIMEKVVLEKNRFLSLFGKPVSILARGVIIFDDILFASIPNVEAEGLSDSKLDDI